MSKYKRKAGVMPRAEWLAGKSAERAMRDAPALENANVFVDHVRALGGSIERAYLRQQPWPGLRMAVKQGRLFRCAGAYRLNEPLTN
jgi:hypothetical protein